MEPETKSNWWATLDAAGRKPDSRIAPPAAGNGGAFGLAPTESAVRFRRHYAPRAVKQVNMLISLWLAAIAVNAACEDTGGDLLVETERAPAFSRETIGHVLRAS